MDIHTVKMVVDGLDGWYSMAWHGGLCMVMEFGCGLLHTSAYIRLGQTKMIPAKHSMAYILRMRDDDTS
jgi:hypothetical protein